MSRLAVLGAAVLVAGLLLGSYARHGVFPRRHDAPASASYPETTVTLVWHAGRLDPGRIRVPRGRRLTLDVETRDDTSPGRLGVPGYGMTSPSIPIVPGERRSASFATDRPGDGFEITVRGIPSGRLDVTGEHLEEEHR